MSAYICVPARPVSSCMVPAFSHPAYSSRGRGHITSAPQVRNIAQERHRSRGLASCSLTVLRDQTLRRLLPSQFTGDQWKYYWGITESDKFGKIYEAASATFFGLWTSWFLTFLIGLPAATVLGTVFLFYWILAPGLAAYRRNVSFRGTYFARTPRDDGVFGALFSGRVVRVGRIRQAREYNRPEALVMSMEDESGRKLRVYAPILPSYKKVRPGMRCEGLVLSESPDFDELMGVSDVFVPDCGAWVGEYPYIDKVPFKAFLASRARRRGGMGEEMEGNEGFWEEEGVGGEEYVRPDMGFREGEEEEGDSQIFDSDGGGEGGDGDVFARVWEEAMRNGRRRQTEEEEGAFLSEEDRARDVRRGRRTRRGGGGQEESEDL